MSDVEINSTIIVIQLDDSKYKDETWPNVDVN
jgi:hypothetical protein